MEKKQNGAVLWPGGPVEDFYAVDGKGVGFVCHVGEIKFWFLQFTLIRLPLRLSVICDRRWRAHISLF